METYNLTDLTLPGANYEIILKGGRVVDSDLGLDGIMDVAVADGKIVAVEKELTGPCFNVIDCTGRLVIPGFLDSHAHCYYPAHLSLPPDTVGVYSGVPTVIDGGSAGYMTFPDFHRRYISRAITDVYAFLHHHPVGQYAHGSGRLVHSEIWDSNLIKIQDYRVLETVEEYRDSIVGIKNRAIDSFLEYKGLKGLEGQLKLCERCGLPYTVHIGEAHGEHLGDELIDSFTRGLLERLRPGDIIAHAFTAKRGRLFREDGAYDDLIARAVERGVLLDACPGRTNVSFQALRLALARGFKPDLIGSDYNCLCVQGINRNFGLNLSRFLAMGLPLTEVLAMATINPARALGLADRKGSLRVGRTADISVLNVVEGDYTFLDHEGGTPIQGSEMLSPAFTVRDGRVYHAIHNGLTTP